MRGSLSGRVKGGVDCKYALSMRGRATAAGLFAAIPAVIGYNHFINRLRHFGAEMDDFSVEFLNLIERSFG